MEQLPDFLTLKCSNVMHKGNNDYATSKIVVDFYNPQKDGRFVCSCFTPGASTQIEPDYLVKTVTFAELKDLLADDSGRVFVSTTHEEGHFLSFAQYLDTLDADSIMEYCQLVINKRESRNHLFFQSESLKTA